MIFIPSRSANDDESASANLHANERAKSKKASRFCRPCAEIRVPSSSLPQKQLLLGQFADAQAKGDGEIAVCSPQSVINKSMVCETFGGKNAAGWEKKFDL